MTTVVKKSTICSQKCISNFLFMQKYLLIFDEHVYGEKMTKLSITALKEKTGFIISKDSLNYIIGGIHGHGVILGSQNTVGGDNLNGGGD